MVNALVHASYDVFLWLSFAILKELYSEDKLMLLCKKNCMIFNGKIFSLTDVMVQKHVTEIKINELQICIK